MTDTGDTTPDTTPQNNPETSSETSSATTAGDGVSTAPAAETPAKKAAAKKTARKSTAKKAAAKKTAPSGGDAADESTGSAESTGSGAAEGEEQPKKAAKKAAAKAAPAVLFQAPEKKAAPARKKAAKKTANAGDADGDQADTAPEDVADAPAKKTAKKSAAKRARKKPAADAADEQAEQPTAAEGQGSGGDTAADAGSSDGSGDDSADGAGEGDEGEGSRRRRRRGGRRRRKGGGGDSGETDESADETNNGDDGDDGDEGGSRRRRTRSRTPKNPEDEITSVSGSTRLEAKKQRRREGREAGRRRAPIVSEAEFLARRESVDRVMVIRQKDDLTQIGVLEDKVLVEHYVARESQTSLIGNIYLGRVQNVLPSMEAAFIDIGKGRNAVLYAGEVNWKALGHKDGEARKIESVLKSGQPVLVQVTKDPIGHKGARLTGQISLPGRFLVYVPDGTTSGISRKLPDTERNRLKTLLKQIVPETAGVIVRTAAEGASEDELTHDVERLTARWADIEAKVQAGRAPELLYGEPDLTLKVVRDLFTEDFAKLVVQGDDAWDLVDGYVSHVAPDLRERLERFEAGSGEAAGKDVFAAYRVDEQIAKGLDRKVWLPSGGSLIIDRTEAMTVVDVNTGKFTGSGGNLEETVTKNNLEAAEEIVRQLRLRDIGGIIVVDFIDMVLESNRDLVLRRLVECLGRDRTRHQVAEVTSLGLVQMTRKRIGTGLLEAFGEECEHCKGRGVVIHDHPIEPSQKADAPRGRRARGGKGRGKGGDQDGLGSTPLPPAKPSPKDLAGTRPPVDREAADGEGAPDQDPDTEAVAPEQSGSPSGPAAPAVEHESTTSRAHDDEPAAQERDESAPAEQPAGAETAPIDTAPIDTAPIDTAPKVVSTRRRRAARPAGPPAGADTQPTAVEVGSAPAAETAAETAGETADPEATQKVAQEATQDLDPAADPTREPNAPADGHDGDGHDGDVHDGDVHDEDGHDEDGNGVLSLLHVPIKKKGSRKR